MAKQAGRLNPPVFPSSVIERAEVNRAIDVAMGKGIAYIHAPAGFGKTIAMSMWLSARKLPVPGFP